VRREVRLVMADECGVPVRLMTMGRMLIDFGTWPKLADGIGEEGVFGADHWSCVGEVVARALLPFPHLNLFNRGV
jgi:hypothetical protein